MPSGSGGGQQFAPQVFQPPNQAGAATAFGDIGQQVQGQALGNLAGYNTYGTPFQLAYPNVLTSAFNQYNNPYQNQLLQSGTAANEFFTNNVLPLYQQATPYAQAGAGYLANLGNAAANQYPNVLNAANSPNYGAASAGGLTALNTAFDPQSALFNRMQGQLMDQSNVANAIAGLGSSPYGASVTANALGNQAIQWQNNLLNRQQQGIQSALAPANAAVTAQLQGSNALGNLANVTQAGYGGAANLLNNQGGQLTNAASGINQFGGLPYGAYNQIAGNQLGSMQNLMQLGNQGYLLPQQQINNLESYMQLGQSGAQAAAQAAQANNQIGQTNFGQLAGGIGGANQLLFGNSLANQGGLLGMAGLGGGFGGGLVEGAPGVLSGAPAESLIASGLATDASGGAGLSTLASAAAPLAFT